MNSFDDFTAAYYKKFAETLLSFDKGPLADVLAVFDAVVARGGTVWVAGNGGSAAIADHSVCDCTKGTHVTGTQPFRTMSLVSNVAMLTALANDISYDDIFSEPLKYYLTDKDALLVVSSSGNSANVVKACEYAKAQGVPTIAFVGFSGGTLSTIADTVVHIEIDNYGIVEDTHQSLIHMLTQYMRARSKAAAAS
jgi:D-sedoheptulose 7-phosphate isomerase